MDIELKAPVKIKLVLKSNRTVGNRAKEQKVSKISELCPTLDSRVQNRTL